MTQLEYILTAIIALSPALLHLAGRNAKAAAFLQRYLLPAVKVADDVLEAPTADRLTVLVADLKAAGTLDEAMAVAVRLEAALQKKLAPKVPVVAAACLALVGCAGAPTGQQIQTGVTVGGDVANAVCAILETIPQTDTTTTQFVCSEIPKLGATTPPRTFLVSVPKASAAKFATDHCVQAGSGSPTP